MATAQGKQNCRRIVRCLEEELQCIAKFTRQGSQDNDMIFISIEVTSSEFLCVGLDSYLSLFCENATAGKILSSR